MRAFSEISINNILIKSKHWSYMLKFLKKKYYNIKCLKHCLIVPGAANNKAKVAEINKNLSVNKMDGLFTRRYYEQDRCRQSQAIV